ncbi:MAG: hypothetical protein NUV77_23160 [Thermoguttaceae bacterium]|jgi:hypothetical protein|nr:hypothetical protein [Thermoguttaceae bacterium]
MSVGPLGGVIASAAGTPLAQTKGAETDRAQHEAANQERRVQNEQRAENAAGIGEADGEDHETSERDADGRRPWEIPERPKDATAAPEDSRQAKDPTGQSGTLLDLSG